MELLTKLIRSQCTFFLLLAVITIPKCGSNQSQDLNELEFLQLCPNACWNGIQPGATNLQEAKLQIGKLESQGIVEVTQDAILETNKRIIRLEYKSVGRILIVLDNDIVQRISVQFTELKPYYEVAQFITTFGNPQAQLSKNRVLRPSKGCSEWDQEVVYQTQTAWGRFGIRAKKRHLYISWIEKICHAAKGSVNHSCPANNLRIA